MPDQIIGEHQDFCFYCKKDFNDVKWHNEFCGDIEYKTTLCDCGKDVSIKVNIKESKLDNSTIEEILQTSM
tara:strand:+ start:357 stop:569 length:213 start_codon:yes stop_codon:yes gene_type:complete